MRRSLLALVLSMPLACGGANPKRGATGNGDPWTVRWDASGFVDGEENRFGIQGTWSAANDCPDAREVGLPCTDADTTLVGPDGEPGWSVDSERVCLKGVAPKVDTDPVTGVPAYDLQWGALLGIGLAETDGDMPERLPYDAASRGIVGFSFNVMGSAPLTIRITLPTPTTERVPFFTDVGVPSTDALVPFYQTAQDVAPLDPTVLTAITFQVYTNATAPKPFDFCIENFRVLTE